MESSQHAMLSAQVIGLPARNFVGQLVGNICRENVLEGGKACPTQREPIPGLRKEPGGRLSSLRNRGRCLAQDGGRRSARHRLFWSCFEGPIWNRLRANIA